MYVDNIRNSSELSAPVKCPQNNITDVFPSFSEMVEEMQKARTSPAVSQNLQTQSEEQEQSYSEDWEREWEIEQRRIERERKMSDRAEEKRKQLAIHRAAKRKRLLEYMLYLKETSIERSKEEMQRIEKRDERDIDKTHVRKKTVYVPVNYSGCASFFDEFLK